MPNGFHGTRERWERLIAPLREIDEPWAEFALAHGLTVSENARNWPERSLRWGTDIQKTLQVALADETQKTFSFGLYAWRDEAGKRYWRKENLTGEVSWPEIRDHIEELLEKGFRTVEAWGEEDLKEPR